LLRSIQVCAQHTHKWVNWEGKSQNYTTKLFDINYRGDFVCFCCCCHKFHRYFEDAVINFRSSGQSKTIIIIYLAQRKTGSRLSICTRGYCGIPSTIGLCVSCVVSQGVEMFTLSATSNCESKLMMHSTCGYCRGVSSPHPSPLLCMYIVICAEMLLQFVDRNCNNFVASAYFLCNAQRERERETRLA